ncbi:D-alanyl-D-alanine carboxypeptidase (penicillin-binding protein 5/6) [Actinoplanes octamycinicus]|uniref:D-alanyl-D-alanine carboxypeptidase (Penicillin-binding protein 5/6) n=1 Tax=Actinoplanes octamycinicus TaxID=135948 RepID=A0A7W7MCZ8_9ACTN|nr:D-alanyl-D-alanine carboxypeptidase [Actinoplanes octamycinicus]MBB4745668.1 D-alanyl-D-alanine carboxypeptidase (penicillin-binding protein 5/6) [Actinoplanes octamycinicus]GIE56512.1 D-alanyl-D-alanine carboxypeptidase [Actinoplanes octamycinicus]
MTVTRITAALALVAALVTVPQAAAAPAAASRATAASRTAAVAAEIPCPKPKIAKPSAPPRPIPPADDPLAMKVGGDALATHGLIIPAGAKQPPAVTATTWMVSDLDTGEVLGACGPHVHQTPASVQKTLLAATAIDRLDPNQKIKVVPSDLDIEVNSSAVGIVVGGTYSISTLWLGLLLNSGNDAANALARMAGGGGADGVATTVAAMNAKAKAIGAFQTHAVTPSGLDGKGQFTSAYDLALIARVCFANADFRKYVLTRSAQMPAQPAKKVKGFQFQNENKLIYNYPGAMGGKTGFTTVARHSYVGAAQRNGRRLVVTLLGAEARPMRGWQQGAALLDWGFAQPAGAAVGHLVTPQEVAASAQAAAPGSATAEKATAGAPGVSAAPAGRFSGLSVVAAGTVAVVLTAMPLLLLLTQRRRRRIGKP